MQEAYSFLIFLSIMGLLMSILLLYIHTKETNKNPYFIMSAFLWLLLPTLMTTGLLLNSEKLITSAFLYPISLFLIITSFEIFVRYKKCTYVIPAKCVSFETRGRGWYYAPQFSFRYNGETMCVYSFVSYRKRKFKKNFKTDQTYDIFINPHNPNHCVDKRWFPINTIIVLIFGIIFLVFGTVAVILM